MVSVCTEPLAEQVNITGTNFPPDMSEFDLAGLGREPAHVVAPARVAESPVSLECRLAGMHSFGASTVVFGEVVWIAIRPEVIVDDRVAVELLRPISRLAGSDYAPVREVFSIVRRTYAQWQAGAGR